MGLLSSGILPIVSSTLECCPSQHKERAALGVSMLVVVV